jgi:hypothetical protein
LDPIKAIIEPSLGLKMEGQRNGFLMGFLKESIEAGKERFEGFHRRVQMPSGNEFI